MNQQEMIQRQQANRAAMLASPILAKGAVRLEDGSIQIVTVHQLSTRYEFYVIYKTTTRTARAAKKTWKHFQDFARDYSTDYKPYEDFGSFLEWYAKRNQAAVLGMRLLKAGRLAAVQVETKHESLTTDWSWSPSDNSSDPRDFRKQEYRLSKRISGRQVDESWRGR